MILYQLFSADQAESILASLSDDEWKQGKARKKSLEGTIKQNQEILKSKGTKSGAMLERIGKKIISSPEIQLNHIPQQIQPPKFSRYVEGDRYHRHTDAPWMGGTRTDLSCTLWLNDDYEGGELCVEGKEVKGKPGQCLVYECGLPHEVKPITSGERICAVTWIQSRIRDSKKRRLVTDFRTLLAKLEPEHPDWLVEGGAIHSALIRMWME